jgi:glyoxylase-like metal-dependent hydrolase (beta-lactamase superfamily II)
MSASIHTYTSPGPGSVNTHWIESPAGVVVIDAQRLLSQARQAIAEIARSGKAVEALILTHAHPDHIGGAQAFAEKWPSARILASQATIDSIRADQFGLLALARHWLGEDFAIPAPVEALAEGSHELAGLALEARDLGPGEAPSMTVLYFAEARALFAADVVCNGMTPFLAERRTSMWLAQLDRIAAAFPQARTVYPGHGASGEASALIGRTREYLTRLRGLVASKIAKSRELTPEIRNELLREIEGLYPDYPPVAAIPDMLGMNVEGVWGELIDSKG